MNRIILKLTFLIFVVGLVQSAVSLASSGSLVPSAVSPSQYKKGFGPGEQEWGFVNVRKGAHMFYWLFYVQNPKVMNPYDRPLVIWLQGGPGGSSSGFGNFEEIGPLFINGTERPSSWAKHVNLLFIDNPVGAGFSYVENLSDLTTNNEQIGKDMVGVLSAFYKKYSKFEKTPLYIFCESYGGKMAVEIGSQLLVAIENGQLKANFKGLGLGDSWISPVDSVLTWAPFLYESGLVDKNGFEKITSEAKKVEDAVKNKQFSLATDLWAHLEKVVIAETNNVDFYNILYRVKMKKHRSHGSGLQTSTENQFVDLPFSREFDDHSLQDLMEGPVKQALGIPDYIIHNQQSGVVFKYLSGDFMKPVTAVVEDLLNNTDLEVAVFSGTLDLIVDTPGTVHWVDRLNWEGAQEWKSAPRIPMVLDGHIEGYVKNVDNLYLYWVLRAGHMVPSDNPSAALEVLRRTTQFDEL